MINPEAFVQGILSAEYPGHVASAVPPKVPDPFIMHTAVSSVPVSNGDALMGSDTQVAVTVSARENVAAREAAFRVVEVLQEAYDGNYSIAGQSMAFFQAVMLPVRQPSVTTTNSPGRYQYDATFRLIIAQ